MHRHRLFVFICLTAVAGAQTHLDPAPVETAVQRLFEAIHRDDINAARQLFSADGKFYLPAGAQVDIARPGSNRFIMSNRACALYVRHVQMITPDAAYVVALRRCPESLKEPPFRRPAGDSGTLDLTMRREPSGWRLMSWREASLEGVARASTEPSAIDSDVLTLSERGEGWISLFDGKSFRGWVSPSGEDTPPPSWQIVDGALATVPRRFQDAGGRAAGVPVVSLRTRAEFTNFDLKFDWKVQANANSGCIYRLFTASDGMEYQIADDNGDPGARVDPRQRSGALYGVTPVEKSVAKPIGEWNEARIRVTAERIEHWLNGVKTAEFPVDVPLSSPIVLQYHFTEVRFRNLRIRRLP